MTARSLRSGFLRSAAVAPTATALIVRDATFSYGDLEHCARIWAHAIVSVAGGPARRVGVFGYRSATAYAGVLASLFSGAAFVPLNPTFPPARTRAMIARADLDAIIVDPAGARQLAEVVDGLDRVPPILAPDLDELDVPPSARTLGQKAVNDHSPLRDLPSVDSDDIAYLLFTSGSTGIPKGVPVSHHNVLHFVDWASRRYGITPQDRFSQTFDQTFDLSVFDLFVAWENGACVCAMQTLDLLAPARFAARHALTVWFSVPSVPALMLKKNSLKPGIFPTLRWSLFCGEPLPRATAKAWQVAAPGSIVENLYGPTELTIACLVHRWNTETSPALCVNDLVPIGIPFEGLTGLVLDDKLQRVPECESGELCVSGPQTVPGYWNAPEKTAEQFVSIALPDGSSARFYRTGDRVRRLPGGDYVYLGRTDHQVKVLGHRVELSEVEATLSRHEGVAQAVVLGWPVHNGSAEALVAFVTGASLNPQQIVGAVRQTLPDYMTPRTVFVLDTLPLNANGKIDRKALRDGLEAGQYAGHV